MKGVQCRSATSCFVCGFGENGIVFEKKKYVSLVQVISSIMHWLSFWSIHKKLALKIFLCCGSLATVDAAG
jgi:hypothetical protein